VVWDAHATLRSRKEQQSFELLSAEVKKACPEVPGIRLKYRVLIAFPKCLLYVISNLFLLTPEVIVYSSQDNRCLNSISVLSTVKSGLYVQVAKG